MYEAAFVPFEECTGANLIFEGSNEFEAQLKVLHKDAARKSRLVWCSKDRSQAWLDLMLKGKVPEGKGDCDNPVDENLALGAKLRVDGTPAMILANDKRIPGYAPAARLEALLDASDK